MLVLAKSAAAASRATLREIPGREARPEVTVVLTSREHMTSALWTGTNLARRLGARIRIVVPEIVPFPAPLTDPPIVRQWNEDRLRRIAEESPVETSVHFYLCRDPDEILMRVLPEGAVVVLAGQRRRLWPTSEERLAGRLAAGGYEVVFAAQE